MTSTHLRHQATIPQPDMMQVPKICRLSTMTLAQGSRIDSNRSHYRSPPCHRHKNYLPAVDIRTLEGPFPPSFTPIKRISKAQKTPITPTTRRPGSKNSQKKKENVLSSLRFERRSLTSEPCMKCAGTPLPGNNKGTRQEQGLDVSVLDHWTTCSWIVGVIDEGARSCLIQNEIVKGGGDVGHWCW